MARIKQNDAFISTAGDLPGTGSSAPDFILTGTDLADIGNKTFSGKKLLLNIFPSIDTPVCATSVRKFNAAASGMENVAVLCISADLPFAQKRFCGAEGLENVVNLSTFRHPEFGERYGVGIIEGPLTGLMSRAVVVVGADGSVIYTEQVPQISQEPNYEAALSALREQVVS